MTKNEMILASLEAQLVDAKSKMETALNTVKTTTQYAGINDMESVIAQAEQAKKAKANYEVAEAQYKLAKQIINA
jgi:FMN-dependent NADH-azoreductase